jgi:defect-in-organelle-trafficking protein DotD
MSPTLQLNKRREAASFVLALSTGMLLAGCATVVVPTEAATPGMPNAELALQKSMEQVDIEMGRIGRQGRGPAVALPEIVPNELDRVVSFEWSGPLDGAIQSLATTIGYTVAIRAPSNAQPLVIAVSKGPQRVYDILQQIGEDAGAQATVSVDPQHHTVEVIHHV